MIAHMGMNGIVVLGQIVFKDQVNEQLEKQSQISQLIYHTILSMYS